MSNELDPAVLAQLGDRLAAHSGLRLPDWVLSTRVRGRMDALGVATVTAYADLLQSRGGEIDVLVEALRVGETRFFRHRSTMHALAEVVVPALRDTGRATMRAWSAGCASGEEPYSLAIMLRQGLPTTVCVEVLGTDISDRALRTARAATYPSAALAHVPESFRSAFERRDDSWHVSAEYTGLVAFERRNITEGGFPRNNDIIMCRNVLIYFDQSARRHAIERMIDALEPGGFLFLGYSETLRDFPALEPVRTRHCVLYRKRAGDAPASARVASQPPAVSQGRPRPPAEQPARRPAHGVVVLEGRYEGKNRITRELGEVMKEPHRRVIVEADGAELLDDEAAAVLRRARAAAAAEGVEFRIAATRPGTRRWLRRMGLSDE